MIRHFFKLSSFTAMLAASLTMYAQTPNFRYEGFKSMTDSEAQEIIATDDKFYGKVIFPQELDPGLYRLTVPYRTSGDWNTGVFAYMEYSGQPGGMLTAWNIIPASKDWNNLSLIAKIDRKNAPVLTFNKSKDTGKIEWMQVKTPEIKPVALPPGSNWFSDNGYFQGNDGSLPYGWNHYEDMVPERNGLTGDTGFEQSPRVLKFGADDKRNAQLQSLCFPFPADGNLEFSVWAKSATELPARITVFLLGDNYKWMVNQRFQLNSQWQKCTVRGKIPDKTEKAPFFWCRVDIEKGQQALLGKVELKQPQAEVQASIFKDYPANLTLSRNLITNPDFELGLWGWSQYLYAPGLPLEKYSKNVNRKEPEIIGGGVNGGNALRVDEFTCLTSYCFPIEHGKKYTVSAWMKNAIPGQTADCTMFMLDNKWINEAKRFRLSDNWQRYSFTVDWKSQSQRGNVYLRFDPINNPVIIDNVQAEQGNLSDFSAPPVQLGLVTSAAQSCNIFNDTDRKATLTLNAVCRPDIAGKIKIKTVIKDAWGNEIAKRESDIIVAPIVTLQLPVNPDGIRGVFHVAMTAFDAQGKMIGYGESRYAVCRNLSGKNLPDNPMAGHFELLATTAEQTDKQMRLLNNYLPVNSYNRCFFPARSAQYSDPVWVAETRKLLQHWTWDKSVKRIMVLSDIYHSNEPWAREIVDNDNFSQEALNQFVETARKQVAAFRGIADGWELFNEPNLWRHDKGPNAGKPSMSPEKAARLHKAVYPAIKAVDPSIMVVGPCGNGEEFLSWSERFLKAGGAGCFDVFSFHGYCDSADMFDMYGRIKQTQAMLEKYGMKNVKIWNTEQYFAPRIPYIIEQEGEYYRNYFRDREIDSAAALTGNLIHHAAAGSRLAMFAFYGNTHRGFEKEIFLNDFFAAGNAAIEQLGNAGTGEPVELGAALKCFLFPNAKGGPLATVHTTSIESKGSMTLPPGIKVFDMMGNAIDGMQVNIGCTPVYLHFPAGTSAEQAVGQLRAVSFLGLGQPFTVSVGMAGKDMLAVSMTNRLNKSASGSVTLLDVPAGWKFADKKLDFSNVEPGKTEVLRFQVAAADLKELTDYKFKFGLKSGDEYFTRTATLSMVFAAHLPAINGDGDLKKWEKASWTTLGKDNVTLKFNPNADWDGPADLTAEIACGWNENGFGLAVIVTDNKFCFPDKPQSWENDSLQIYFDMKKDATPESAARKINTGDDVSYQIGYTNGKTAVAFLDHAPAGRFIGEANRQEGIDGAVKITCRQLAPNRLLYDIFLPQETLPLVKFKPGNSFGFSLLVNDNDGPGRKTGLSLAPKGKEPFGNPHEYRDLIMLP